MVRSSNLLQVLRNFPLARAKRLPVLARVDSGLRSTKASLFLQGLPTSEGPTLAHVCRAEVSGKDIDDFAGQYVGFP